ncbi:MAG: hypothetical protein V3T23_12080 [Nitrososphaerales archaeon]
MNLQNCTCHYDVTICRIHDIKAQIRAQSQMAEFNSGATRTAEPLEDPEGFLSPVVIQAYCQYMSKHRKQEDGKVRNSDNWQKGMPKARYMRSMWRHFFDVWYKWRNFREPDLMLGLLNALCALLFNVQGMMLEVLISMGRTSRPVIRSEEEDVPKQQ